MIDKDYDPGDVTEDHSDLLAFIDAMKDEGYRTREFTIGPVDVIASKVGISVLDNPVIVDLVSRFEGAVVPLALLNDDGLDGLCVKLNKLLAGKTLKIATPFPLKSVSNVKHHQTIRSRLKYIEERIPDVKFDLFYLTVNMIGDDLQNFTKEVNEDIHDIDFGVRRLIEYVFPHSRKGFSDILAAERFKRDFSRFTYVIKQSRDTVYNRHLIKPTDDSLEITYRGGELFYTPTLIEKFPIFTDRFKINAPWDVINVEHVEEMLYYDNIVNWSSSDLCYNCCNLGKCSRGDIHTVMTELNSAECLVNLKNNAGM